jgi:serine protease Do
MSVIKLRLVVFIMLLLTAGFVACFSEDKPKVETTSNSKTLDPALIAPAEQLQKAFAAIAAHVRPAVVSVFSEKIIKFQRPDLPFPFGDDLFREFFGNQFPIPKQRGKSREYSIPQQGMGSGMLLDNQGHILTNFHVVNDVDEIKVQFADQQSFKARIIGKDARTDVAIIQVQGRGIENYQTVSLGDSDTLHVGDFVLAIGAPFGLTQTVTHGIISATGRADVGIADYEDFLQTDAPINPGNSGGPLVNIRGEVIGMNSAIATMVGQSGGVAFSIPSNMIKNMLPRIIKGQTIKRGELGVVIQDLTEDLIKHFGLKGIKGVLVSQVIAKSAAEKAGIKPEDIITTFNGKPANDVRTLRNLIAGTAPGANIKLELLRNGKTQTLILTIQEQKAETTTEQATAKEPTSNVINRLGLNVETLSKELAYGFHTKVQTGVIILDIDEGSPAQIAQLQIGDVIVECNHKPIKTTEDFSKSLSAKSDESILLLIDRMGTRIFVSIRLD